MALTTISDKKLYLALSTDISTNKISGAGNIGWNVLTTDDNKYYIVGSDGNLVETGGSSVSLSSGNSFIGSVGSKSNVIDYSFVLDNNNAYAIGDVMAITAVLPNFYRINGGTATILGVRLLDLNKQNGDLDVLLFRSMVDIGAINSPYDITIAEASDIIARFVFTSGDYTTWTNFSDAHLFVGDYGFKVRTVKGASDSKSIYIAAIAKSAKTYTTGGLKFSIQYVND